MRATIKITLKPGVLDPQGKAINEALNGLGMNGVTNVRQGKLIELDLATSDEAQARQIVEQACSSLLANAVIENFTYELRA